MVSSKAPDHVRVVKPFPRFREHEEFLRYPNARPEGPMGLPADINALGYKVRFIEEIAGGYKVNVLRDNGLTPIARGVRLRKYFFAWEASVTDAVFDNVIALKLSSNSPDVLRITVIGDGEVTDASIKRAVRDLSHADRHDLMGAALHLARAVSEGREIGEAVGGLADCLSHHVKGVRVNAAYALAEYAKMHGDIKGAENALLDALGHEDGRTRRGSARALMYHYITSCDGSGMEMMLSHPIGEIKAVARAVYQNAGLKM